MEVHMEVFLVQLFTSNLQSRKADDLKTWFSKFKIFVSRLIFGELQLTQISLDFGGWRQAQGSDKLLLKKCFSVITWNKKHSSKQLVFSFV